MSDILIRMLAGFIGGYLGGWAVYWFYCTHRRRQGRRWFEEQVRQCEERHRQRDD